MRHQIKQNIWDQLNLELVDHSGLLNDVFWYLDRQANTLHFSRNWMTMTGYHQSEIVRLKDYLKIIHPHDISGFLRQIKLFQKKTYEITAHEMAVKHRIVCRTGRVCTVMLKIRQLLMDDGQMLVAGTLSDRYKEPDYFLLKDDVLPAQKSNMINRLRRALLLNQFFVMYQPQYDAVTGKINGMEALLRWQDGDKVIPPLDFIPIAEISGLMVPIGHWVLKEVFRQISCWKAHGLPVVPVAVNISTTQFQASDFFLNLKQLFDKTGVDPGLIELEITESIYINTSKNVQKLLDQLRDMGVRIALDDFGSGYSSLTYIKHFKLDRLKIDRSFIQDIQSDSVDSAIINTIVMLAHILKLSVVAEGVETKDQYDFLCQIGCNTVQGYYFSVPVNACQIVKLLS